jgi:hypothetical protein
MIEGGTPIRRGKNNHQSSTIDLIIASKMAAVSMAGFQPTYIHIPTVKRCVGKLVIVALRKIEGFKHHSGTFGSQLKMTT